MGDTKSMLQSKAVWGSIVTILALIAGMFNLGIDLQTQDDIVNVIMVIVGVIGSIFSIYGRIRATKTIK